MDEARNAFVFVACGERHAVRLAISLKFLRRFTRCEIIVVKHGFHRELDCDRVVEPAVPRGLDNHKSALFLKTSLHRIFAGEARKFCYLDNDVVCVSSQVDSIFGKARKPVSFAADHCHLRQFSPYAVSCGCSALECDHLRQAIRRKFKVTVAERKWRHWNGGVFVFDRNSSDFMERWHRNTLSILDDPGWKTRDQGTLAATVWQMGLQDQPTLSRDYNFIVDPLGHLRASRRGAVKPGRYLVNDSYSLSGAPGKAHPILLHMINGGLGKRGWKNWDDAEDFLETTEFDARGGDPVSRGSRAAKPESPHTSAPLSDDNRTVHSLWIGPTLSKMELLTIRSFLRHGHEFHLWVYGDLATPLPKEVVLEDANEIIPQSRVVQKAETDPETGVGKGSYSSPFSDLFRYKLLHEKGGYWVDMDVTCLRPFAYSTPYVFRRHRVGVVGNIMKCPPKSRLMRTVYDQVARYANEHSEWLMPNRILSRAITRLRLTRYIRDGSWNEEMWWDAVRPLALGDDPVPPHWVAIHWINEFWRMLKQNNGTYRGRRLFETAPDKESPKPGSALARLYADHDLAAPAAARLQPANPQPAMPAIQAAARQLAAPQFSMTSHINILLPSLTRGGAERSVLETLAGLHRRNSSAKLFLFHDTRVGYAFDPAGSVRVHRLSPLGHKAKLDAIASEVLASPESVLFAHMIPADVLLELCRRGVSVVPVIQNSRQAWLNSPAEFGHPNIPFVAAVSDAVGRDLRAEGCPRPVIVVRHELQRWFNAQDLQQNRRQIRDRHGIPDDTLVIGMVGQFKSQKAYTRAVRVLAQIRQHQPAKLMILGGWDSDWGYGRQAYTAACRLALDLDVITDLLAIGPVPDAERYYPAFDVFLNTSIHEGLSVALLEAIQAGCPIVTADAGGNREILPEHAILVRDSADTAAYVLGIAQALHTKPRTLPQLPEDFDLVPRLWVLLGKCRRPAGAESVRSGTLFVANDLNTGEAQRSLAHLLAHLPSGGKTSLCVLNPAEACGHKESLEKSGVPMLSLHDARDYLDRLERILHLVERLKVRNLCLWGVDPRIKLLLAKILPAGAVRLIDVAAAPAFLAELESAGAFQRRIAFGSTDYWARLDHLVCVSTAPAQFPIDPGRLVVIPNGVPTPSTGAAQAPLLPKSSDPDLVIGTTCQIEPGAQLDLLIDMMAYLNERLSGATLVVVGGVRPAHADTWAGLLELLRSRKVANVHFAGPQADATPFLRMCKVFATGSSPAGSPVGLLEAMALGLPVVGPAADAPGPVLDGINGFLAAKGGAREMAHRVRCLLVNPQTRRRLGEAARITAAKDFSVDWMARRFARLLDPPPVPSPAPTGAPRSRSKSKEPLRSRAESR